jgi:hypothetical protein
MSVRKTILTAAVVWAFGSVGAARAADMPVPYSTAPAAMAAGPYLSQGCTGCAGGGLSRFTAGVPSCPDSACDTRRFQMHNKKPPYVVNLCPGGCFGYFPTQWRSWDEACGVPEMPRPIPHLPPSSDRTPAGKKNGDGLPPPRPVDPKTGMPIPPPGVGSLPSIPLYPGLGGKF